MGRIRILAIEDDPAVSRLLRHSLAREDYDLQIAGSGEEGLALAEALVPALVLLDLGLPGIDGLEVCRRLRAETSTRSVPIIILSGKGEESDVVRGLEMGADDYMVKPFSPRILNARLHAVLRRRDPGGESPPEHDALQLGAVRINPAEECVLLDGAPLTLSPVEYRFVYMLLRFLIVEQGTEREDEISGEGATLYAENRLERLLPLFEALLSAVPAPEPTLAALVAMAVQSRDADRCRDLLDGACRCFVESNHPIGELVTSALLVQHHLVFDGDTDAALVALQRVDALYLNLFPLLNSPVRIIIAQALALGTALLFGDFAHAEEHLAVAEALVEERGLVNLAVVNYLLRNLELTMQGQMTELGRGVESIWRLRQHPQVSAVHRSLLCLCPLCTLELRGDFDYLQQVEGALQAEFAAIFPPQSLLRQRLVVVQIESALWRGDVAAARKLLLSIPRGKGLLWPLLAGMEQLCLALGGETPSIPNALRWTDGTIDISSYTVGQGVLFVVRAFMAAGQPSAAEELLATVFPQLDGRYWPVMQLQATALKLLGQLVIGERLASEQLQQLRWLLQELRQLRLVYLPGLLPQDMAALLKAAHLAQLETNFVGAYARERLRSDFDEAGDLRPMLRLTTLGGVQLDGGAAGSAEPAKFSRSQRECLALLVAAPDGQIDQEALQLLFWPDSSPEKGRSNLDTMLSRLRKTLQDSIAPLQAKDYLKLQKGTISLEGVDADAHRLLAGLRRGQVYCGVGDCWHADVAFTTAFALWRGSYAPGACATDQAAEYAERIHVACLEATLLWSEMLIESGQSGRAEVALLHAVGFDRGNALLNRALYRCYMRGGDLKRALALLQSYGESLRRDGCSATEIAHAVAAIKVAPAAE